MRKMYLIFAFSLLISSYPTIAFAYTDWRAADSNPSILYDLTIRSPLRTDDFVSEKAFVNATYNEPRGNQTNTTWHRGTDYKTKNPSTGANNRNVYAVYSGTVFGIGFTSTSGNYIIIRHYSSRGQLFYSTYMHLSSISVSVGDAVTQSSNIGVSGNTGEVAPHLHWELNTTNTTSLDPSRHAMDPTPYIYNYYYDSAFASTHSMITFVSNSGNTVYSTVLGRDSTYGTQSPSSAPTIYYKYTGDSTYQSATMNGSGTSYYYTIPHPSGKTTVSYTIKAYYNGYYGYYTPIWATPASTPDVMSSNGYAPYTETFTLQ